MAYSQGVNEEENKKSEEPEWKLLQESERTTEASQIVGEQICKVGGPIVLDETEEEREKRLAKRRALTLKAFQIAYDNHH